MKRLFYFLLSLRENHKLFEKYFKIKFKFFSIKKIKAIPLNKNKKVNYNILKRYA